MTWIKLDDKAPRHWKIAALTDKAFRWWINGLCYASEFLTNGVLHPTFWKHVPKQSRAELTSNRLWEWEDPNFVIHDYLGHQSSKESVDQKRADSAERVARYRERKRNGVTGNTGNSVTSNGGNANVTAPDTETDTENREQRQRTETTPPASRGPALVMSPREWDRLKETHAFVGSKLRVPKVLHFELMGKSGENADRELQAWYLALNDELEQSGKGTGDVFAWLRPRHQAFAVTKGWIEPAPNGTPVKDRTAHLARLAAIERGEIKR